ncbi:DUF4124 domain-containing protein [Photobacterium sanguinicancri]|uniref:DUF4124 domain-containing protein n=1 Tax=Photobacterium sanguinicancri TaxID=875932 RepID=UPI003D11AA5C
MIKSWFTCALVLCCTIISIQAHANIYTWTDENGIVHFSDQPHAKADIFPIDVAPVSKPPKQPTNKNSATSAQGNNGDSRHLLFDTELPKHAKPSSIQIMSPLHEQTIRNNEGIITLSAVANRTMDKGHTAKLYLDGKAYGKSQTRLDWRLVDIDRGSHQLQVKLLKYGKVIASSEKITVFLHRASRLHPNRP